jgi:PEP-CTERM motif-containing protein
MKIRSWTKKLSAALVAGGLMAPLAANAAPTGINLVVNPGFENVDLTTTSYYNSPQILDWTATNPAPGPGFAYSHDLSGASVPDFANGTLATGGHWYFTPGNYALGTGSTHNSRANAITQVIDVSTGPSASLIATGGASYDLRAFFSTYAAQPDRGFVRAEFLGALDVGLGIAEVSTPAATVLSDWTQFSASGLIPIGAQKVRIASWGETTITGSPDGYTDNVSFSIVPEPSSILLVGLGLAGAGCGLIRRRKES